MKSIAVYCGSAHGAAPVYAEGARALGRAMAAQGLGLVYGGGNVGLMGVIADEVMRGGGTVIGVIPQALMDREVGHMGLTRLHVVKDMHERKAMMADLADGFIAMPGGMGTLEELFEMLTWSQLGIHHKPIGLLNVDGYYDRLLGFVAHMQEQGFVKPQHAALMMAESGPDALLARLRAAASRMPAGPDHPELR
ncbi:MAG TPA: TIGR00730 family Rossman fold protein [Telluria sp.]|nr:TIGR00730 family Rossman fold protein [Telluria sp.]